MPASDEAFSPEVELELAAAREFGRRRTRLRVWCSAILLLIFLPIGCAVSVWRSWPGYSGAYSRVGPPETFIAFFSALGLAELIVRWRTRKLQETVAAEFGVDPSSLDLAARDVTL